MIAGLVTTGFISAEYATNAAKSLIDAAHIVASRSGLDVYDVLPPNDISIKRGSYNGISCIVGEYPTGAAVVLCDGELINLSSDPGIGAIRWA